MNGKGKDKTIIRRCAIYTRKSTDEGLDSDFNSLDAQRESAEAYIKSQQHEGWELYPEQYNDGGYSGGNMERPAVKRLLLDAQAGKFDCVVVYKVDRLSRSLIDFAKIVEVFDQCGISFVAVTQQFNTTTSMGRLTLNILLSFAQFEREIISERTRDKLAAAAKRGKWHGGFPVLGYDVSPDTKGLTLNQKEAEQVRILFNTYLECQSLTKTAHIINQQFYTKRWTTKKKGQLRGGQPWNKARVVQLLKNPIYLGKICHNGDVFDGQHEAIIDQITFDRVQALMARNCQRKTSDAQDKYNFLLRGLLRCGCCGSAMSPSFSTSRKTVYHYYVCTAVNKLDRTACEVRRVPARPIEAVVLERIGRIANDPVVVESVIQKIREQCQDNIPQLKQEQSEMIAEANSIKQEADGLLRAVAKAGDDQLDFLVNRIRELEELYKNRQVRIEKMGEEIRQWEAKVVSAEQIQNLMRQFKLVFDKLEPLEQKELVRLLIREVRYDPIEGQIKIGFRNLPLGSLFSMDNPTDVFDESISWLPGTDANTN